MSRNRRLIVQSGSGMRSGAPVTAKRARKAFTLIELLVVIGIIGVLLSILLPVLSKVHRAANTLACDANLHQILLAMQNYCSQNNNYVPGSPLTTGAFLYYRNTIPYSLNSAYYVTGSGLTATSNIPGVVSAWDWQSPLGVMMGLHLDLSGTETARMSRFNLCMNSKIFSCAENQWVATEYDASLWNGNIAIPAPSYFTAADFLMIPNILVHGKYQANFLKEIYCPWSGNQTSSYFQTPSNYFPKLTLVGIPSRKIYIADGGLYGTAQASGAAPPAIGWPNYDCDYHGTVPGGNAYSDWGDFDGYSRALTRGGDGGTQSQGVPTNPPNNINAQLDATDPRLYGFRHGALTPFGPVGSYKFNAGFFDGHVETFDDLSGADPSMWNPPNTQIVPAEVMYDVQAMFFPNHPAGSQASLITGN